MKRINLYLDTEFIDLSFRIELISIGLVSESGNEYYAVSSEFNADHANDWVKTNVFPYLPDAQERKSIQHIRTELIQFYRKELRLMQASTGNFWAYFGAYDWALFCWIMGGMINMPREFPHCHHELRQEINRLNLSREEYPPKENAHHALADAHWNRKLHQVLQRKEFELRN